MHQGQGHEDGVAIERRQTRYEGAPLLGIETSGDVCRAALLGGGVSLEARSAGVRDHGQMLTRLIQRLLEEASQGGESLCGVAVSGGPGSYTGLRIGVSAAKGLCFAWRIPLLGINTLQAIAHAMQRAEPNMPGYLALIDARRDEVYAQPFDSSLNPLAPPRPIILDGEATEWFARWQRFATGGSGATKATDYLARLGYQAPLPIAEPLAADVAMLGLAKLAKGEQDNLAYYEPEYLKDFGGLPLPSHRAC